MFEFLATTKSPQVFEQLWNLTGTHIHQNHSLGSSSYAQGSLIPGANYSAQDDHAGVKVAGL
ncbi:hypothetical protein GUITHDRAFT_154333 [Guillardia theta CCMP2712]|uniref:Uncharacterized protein n=1 Tax=Guillardia theta (strain CCMP2712) TaxID=905079 RepID=L1IUZ1_GUITC|nr:hypothetical protein GUITHDRAFT_154333 [Guillardia theta CCMP2712]EKX39655.1 hypothetical protein GUITHDRAFT_154333 [Guillardia theta CCMP2712]|eukprot:XP_005826635.1 hypothetical protein GUITHDRAFT_154333 [Guillardia theta CCMP2712]